MYFFGFPQINVEFSLNEKMNEKDFHLNLDQNF